jgi:hypothetical protein
MLVSFHGMEEVIGSDYYGAARATEDALSTPPDKGISLWGHDLK